MEQVKLYTNYYVDTISDEINEYIEKHPDTKVKTISMCQGLDHDYCVAVVYEQN